ncbi:uncharacterized protein Z519_00405 [Cladophialophora bantiana CBS 173.52]|uniref:Azaphilone pigments biosynthesis cluster protein L N-terminal domain-containing protein n=1 Tax=Cladophialophora bantiana (strain ATCC 10958 / CBS 173.52 / CDC B-1940 / NIH 8579) TaxID=1442370 RepID=A0A0D2GK10_CLAB1|nr:uncharacterized protein Z519_00405 [Cladophialophora bantiana CBS 173.52]KIW98742.1 hypothetical protein Z519_00405 [Cladophialophora bantiana CBS 173.52]
MAEAIGLASGVLALTAFTLQSTKTLYGVLDSFRNNSRNIRELKQELEALEAVLSSLNDIQSDEQIDLSALKLPLLRCGQACRDFADIIEKCTARSNGDKSSFRDWVMLTYRGKDIVGFKNVIGAYKSTITIALADVNIRHTMVTSQLLREYKEMIDNTTSDLQEILEQTNNELAQSPVQGEASSLTSANNLDQSVIEEERANIEYCLSVCKQVANHLAQVQAEIFPTASIREVANDRRLPQTRQSLARRITSEKLRDCRTGIRFTMSELQLRLQDADHRLQRLLLPTQRERGVGEDIPHTQEVFEDLETIRQCLSICDEATEELARDRINVFEDVRMTDDGQQVIVATLGDLISARKVSAGARSKQWLGQMSDASLQQISRDSFSTGDITAATKTFPAVVPGNDILQDVTTEKSPGIGHHRFEGRHGAGRTLG